MRQADHLDEGEHGHVDDGRPAAELAHGLRDTMSRHIWIDKDASADVAKLHAHGISRAYFDARSAPVPAAMFPFERGIYRVQSWDNLDAVTFAKMLSAD